MRPRKLLMQIYCLDAFLLLSIRNKCSYELAECQSTHVLAVRVGCALKKVLPPPANHLERGEGRTTMSTNSESPGLKPVDARIAEIEERFGERLTAEQRLQVRTRIERTIALSVAMRATPLTNADEPEIVFALISRENRSPTIDLTFATVRELGKLIRGAGSGLPG